MQYLLTAWAMAPRAIAGGHAALFFVDLQRIDFAVMFLSCLAFSTFAMFRSASLQEKKSWSRWAAVLVCLTNVVSAAALAAKYGTWNLLGTPIDPWVTLLLVLGFLLICQIIEHKMVWSLVRP